MGISGIRKKKRKQHHHHHQQVHSHLADLSHDRKWIIIERGIKHENCIIWIVIFVIFFFPSNDCDLFDSIFISMLAPFEWFVDICILYPFFVFFIVPSIAIPLFCKFHSSCIHQHSIRHLLNVIRSNAYYPIELKVVVVVFCFVSISM